MKKLVLHLALVFCLLGMAHAQTEPVPFRLKNNSWLPRKYTLISYEPGNSGNNTQTMFLLPGASKAFQFPEGTRLYLASQEQVNTVMAGKSLSNPPWHVVKAADKLAAVPLH